MSGAKKKTFTVEDYGSVDACLSAMKREGYTPVRRVERPFFKDGPKGVEVSGRMISFEGVLLESEQ